MEVICCHFNPMKYQKPLENYLIFRHDLKSPLTTIELSFDGNFDIEDAIHIHGNPQNIMWQKEKLLNILIEQSSSDKIAWLDADVLFENENWYEETIAKLDDHPVVQLFETIDFLGPDDLPRKTFLSTINNMYKAESWSKEDVSSGFAKGGAPGFAWAARKEAIPGGLLDRHVMGSADLYMIYAWLGIWNGKLVQGINPEYQKHFLKSAAPYFKAVKGGIGCISGHIAHLYHGSLKNRHYFKRRDYLVQNNYDPENDIILDNNKLWKWATNKPDMQKDISRYFALRREDE